ncbi:hypothetical protein ACTFIW_000857 [Dictyostelium discoideum]
MSTMDEIHRVDNIINIDLSHNDFNVFTIANSINYLNVGSFVVSTPLSKVGSTQNEWMVNRFMKITAVVAFFKTSIVLASMELVFDFFVSENQFLTNDSFIVEGI